MFNMSGYKISVRGIHSLDEDVPEGATMLVEGEDLGQAPVVAINDEGEVLANYAGVPDEVAVAYAKGAIAFRDALALEQKLDDERIERDIAAAAASVTDH